MNDWFSQFLASLGAGIGVPNPTPLVNPLLGGLPQSNADTLYGQGPTPFQNMTQPGGPSDMGIYMNQPPSFSLPYMPMGNQPGLWGSPWQWQQPSYWST